MPSETSWQSVASLAELIGCPANEIHKAYGKGGRVRGRLVERRGLHEHERKASKWGRTKYAYRASPLSEKKGPGPAGAFDPEHKPAPTYREQPGGDGANMAARAARAEFEEDFSELTSALTAGLDLGQSDPPAEPPAPDNPGQKSPFECKYCSDPLAAGQEFEAGICPKCSTRLENRERARRIEAESYGRKTPAESTESPPASTEPPLQAAKGSAVESDRAFMRHADAAFAHALGFKLHELPETPEGLHDFLDGWNRRFRPDVEAQKNDVFRKFTWDIAGGIVGPEIQSMAIAILREYYEGPK